MDSTQLLQVFREEMADMAEPYLWSDSAIYRYADEAHKWFHRWTEGIEDATSGFTQLAVTPGVELFTLSPLILKLRYARRADNGRPVEIMSIEKAAQSGVLLGQRTGQVTHLITGESKGKVRVWPTPSETVTIKLGTFRLPEAAIDGPGVEFELDDQHHLALLDWMRHLAYSRHDAETLNVKLADTHGALFRSYCEKAKVEQNRARHPAGAVMYGGI